MRSHHSRCRLCEGEEKKLIGIYDDGNIGTSWPERQCRSESYAIDTSFPSSRHEFPFHDRLHIFVPRSCMSEAGTRHSLRPTGSSAQSMPIERLRAVGSSPKPTIPIHFPSFPVHSRLFAREALLHPSAKGSFDKPYNGHP